VKKKDKKIIEDSVTEEMEGKFKECPFCRTNTMKFLQAAAGKKFYRCLKCETLMEEKD